jgi:hypothetical protein
MKGASARPDDLSEQYVEGLSRVSTADDVEEVTEQEPVDPELVKEREANSLYP